jgi:hypothetical protein
VNADISRWRRLALQHGWTIRHTGGHERWYAPNGHTIVTVSTTPQAPRAVRNTRARLRHGGLPI